MSLHIADAPAPPSFGSAVHPAGDVYSPREIARAAGVDVAAVIHALGGDDVFVGFDDAVHLGKALALRTSRALADADTEVPLTRDDAELFGLFSEDGHTQRHARGVPLAISSTLHLGAIVAALFITAVGVRPTASGAAPRREEARLVFVATPGPGGGGGGGGRRQPQPPPRAERAGTRTAGSPVAVRELPAATPIAAPEPVLKAETLPAVVAPVVSLPSDSRDRAGELAAARTEAESRGPGSGAGVGSGAGSGVGEGSGPGLGAGTGGGTGGGPYRPGSGIEPPRLLREVKAEYTEDARRRGIEGDVILELVVRHDGTVHEVRIVERLDPGLDERAVQAVRQWRFSPATRLGQAVDVLVEVAVAFELR